MISGLPLSAAAEAHSGQDTKATIVGSGTFLAQPETFGVCPGSGRYCCTCSRRTSWDPHPLPLPEFPRDGDRFVECQIDHEQNDVTLAGPGMPGGGLIDLDRMGPPVAEVLRTSPPAARRPGASSIGPDWSSVWESNRWDFTKESSSLSRLGSLARQESAHRGRLCSCR